LPAAFPRAANAQVELRAIEPLIETLTGGAQARTGRVTLALPQFVDNGNAVPLTVTVDSPMSATDYVKSIHLISNRNPVAQMANFYLGPRAGRAQLITRVRLAGSQTVTAVAALSDGSFWMESVAVVVTVSACLDES
jgi:sulfur-oxidizing protein SoxY